MFMALKTKVGRAVVAAASFVLLFWEVPWIKRTVGALSGVQFIYDESGWLKKAFNMALNPPPAPPCLLFVSV
jgi:hypothetical protein